MNFKEPACDWSCNRRHQKWCEEHTRWVDFQVYLSTKQTIVNHCKQIKAHQESKAFHPSMVPGIDMMIGESERFIEKLLEQVKQFQDKYRE